MKPIYIAAAIGLAALGLGSAYALSALSPSTLPTFGISLPK